VRRTSLSPRVAAILLGCLSLSPTLSFSQTGDLRTLPESAPGNVDTPSPVASAASAGGSQVEHPYGFRQIGLDTRYLVTRPAHLERNGIVKIALTAGTAGILFLYREDIRDWVQDHRNPERDTMLNQVRIMGKGAFAPSLALIAYGSSLITKNPREKETSVLLLESMGFTGAATGIGQAILASQRPTEGTDVNLFARRGHGVSGDAALAASVVPILNRQYLTLRPGDSGGARFGKVSAAALLYAGAFLTGYQRVNSDAHWAPDAFLGLVTGFSVGQMLCDSHQKTREESSRRVDFSAGTGVFQARISF